MPPAWSAIRRRLKPTRHDARHYRAFYDSPGRTRRREFRDANAERNRGERQAGLPTVLSAPLRLYLEVALQCNLRCPSCFHAYLDPQLHDERTNFMTPFLFERIAAALFPGALMVWYNGNGESLLHPSIDAILRTAQDWHFIPALLTNGLRFRTENASPRGRGLLPEHFGGHSPRIRRLRKGGSPAGGGPAHMQG
jgi:hypothetical protein